MRFARSNVLRAAREYLAALDAGRTDAAGFAMLRLQTRIGARGRGEHAGTAIAPNMRPAPIEDAVDGWLAIAAGEVAV